MIYDTIIIGGGIAGLQTAIQLARSLRRVAVVDAQGGRSMVAKAYRNILGFPDGISGESLRCLGRKQALSYGVIFMEAQVVSLEIGGDDCFLVFTKSDAPPLICRTLVMATGILDPFPAIPGIHDCLGSSVFLCPDCDGYETVGEYTAVIGAGQQAINMAKELAYYSNHIVVINHAGASISPEAVLEMEEQGFLFHDDSVDQVNHEKGKIRGVALSSGKTLDVTRVFLAFPGAHVQTDLLRGFSVRMNEKGHVIVNPRTKETDHPNIWAVGDIVEHSQQVAIAMGDGAQAAIWIQKRLRNEQTP